jgi:hypothetical protein
LLRIHDNLLLIWVSLLVALALANLGATLSAPLQTGQYHLSFAAMLFRNIWNPAWEQPSSSLEPPRNPARVLVRA